VIDCISSKASQELFPTSSEQEKVPVDTGGGGFVGVGFVGGVTGDGVGGGFVGLGFVGGRTGAWVTGGAVGVFQVFSNMH